MILGLTSCTIPILGAHDLGRELELGFWLPEFLITGIASRLLWIHPPATLVVPSRPVLAFLGARRLCIRIHLSEGRNDTAAILQFLLVRGALLLYPSISHLRPNLQAIITLRLYDYNKRHPTWDESGHRWRGYADIDLAITLPSFLGFGRSLSNVLRAACACEDRCSASKRTGATSIVFDHPRATTAVKLRLHRKPGDRRYLAALAVQSWLAAADRSLNCPFTCQDSKGQPTYTLNATGSSRKGIRARWGGHLDYNAVPDLCASRTFS